MGAVTGLGPKGANSRLSNIFLQGEPVLTRAFFRMRGTAPWKEGCTIPCHMKARPVSRLSEI